MENMNLDVEQCGAAATVTDFQQLDELMQCSPPPISAEFFNDCHTPNSPTALQLQFQKILSEFEAAAMVDSTETRPPPWCPNSPTALQELLFSNDAANTTTETEPTITNSLSVAVSSDSSVANLPERNYGRRPQLRVGRWSVEEKVSFCRGLKIYGKGNWKDIAEFVGTRTHIQVGSHAQKYFKHHENRRNWNSSSSSSSSPPSPPPPPQRFTVTNYYARSAT